MQDLNPGTGQGFIDNQSNLAYPGYQGYPAYPVSPLSQINPVNPVNALSAANPQYPLSPAYQTFPEYGDYKFDQNYDSGCNDVLPYAYSPATAPIAAPITGYPPLGSDYMPTQGRYCNEALTNMIFECQATCEYLTTHLRIGRDPEARREQLIVVRDCADICALNVRFVARGSDFDRRTISLCACACETCANVCYRFSDALSQQCARVCCQCAKYCRAFLRGY